jgi:hypothetical protein
MLINRERVVLCMLQRASGRAGLGAASGSLRVTGFKKWQALSGPFRLGDRHPPVAAHLETGGRVASRHDLSDDSKIKIKNYTHSATTK